MCGYASHALHHIAYIVEPAMHMCDKTAIFLKSQSVMLVLFIGTFNALIVCLGYCAQEQGIPL